MSYIYGSPNPLTNNLVMWFDASNPKSMRNQILGTWSDISGRGVTNSVASFGAPVYSAANGGSLVFNGVNTYYRLPDYGFFFPMAAFTIEVWFKLNNNGRYEMPSGDFQSFINFGYGITIELRTVGVIRYYHTNSLGTIGQAYSSLSIRDGKWHQVLVTVDSSNIFMYIDGKLNIQTNPSNWNGASNYGGSSLIGANYNDASRLAFKGNISIVRLYNIALTPTQALQNYNSTATRYKISYPLTNTYLDVLNTNVTNKNLKYENPILNTNIVNFLGTTSNSFTFSFGTASLLYSTSFILTPTVYKENILANIVDTSISSVFTYSRTSTSATRINSQGFIENVPYNLLQQSEDFTNLGIWINLAVPTLRTANATVAPNGTLTADFIIAGASTSHGIRLPSLSSTIYNAALTYSFSVWAKSDNNAVISLDISDITPITFTLSNTWNRYTVTSKGNPLYNNNSAFCDISFLPNQLGKSIYLWGAQLELGTVATTYFPTTDRQNVPRINYNGNTASILLEPDRTNTILYSEWFTFSSWTSSNLTITANDNLAPSNAMQGYTFKANANNAYIQQQTQPTINNNPAVLSWYIRRKTGTGTVSISVGRDSLDTTLSNTWVRYAMTASYIDGSYSSTNGLVTVSTVAPHGFNTNDSFRFVPYSGTATAIFSSIGGVIDINNFTFSNGSFNSSGTCTNLSATVKLNISNTNDEIYVWGAQLERDNNVYSRTVHHFETSYIPTYNTVIRRPVDFFNPPIQSNNYFTQSYCFYMEFDIPKSSRSTSSSGTALYTFGPPLLFYNVINTANATSSFIRYFDQINYVHIGGFSSPTFLNGSRIKHIIKRDINTNIFTAFYNGVRVGTYSPSSNLLAFTRIDFASSASGIIGGEYIMNIYSSYYIQSLLTDAQCIALTK